MTLKKFMRGTKKALRPFAFLLKAIGTALLCVLMIIVMTGIIVASAATVFVVNLMDDTTEISLDEVSSSYTTYIYAQTSDGEWIVYDTLTSEGEKRIWVNLEQIPQYVRDAFVYSEDERFYNHDGVDFYGIATAVYDIVVNDDLRGASTITQQTIKLITGDDDVDGVEGYERKLREIYRAVQLEKSYSKDDILEAYLNLVPLNNNVYGVQAAANYYFNKDVSQLSLAEAATIAAITKSPTANDPIKHPEANYQRRKYILDQMLVNGAISSEEYDEALNAELDLIGSMDYNASSNEDTDYSTVSAYENFDTVSSYYVDAVTYQAVEVFMNAYGLEWSEAYEKLRSGGYEIYTCVDLDIQKAIEEKYLDLYTFSEDGNSDIPQSAFICMDYSGRILAVVGGIGEKESPLGLNRATMSTRQPGSSIKPLASYSLAVENDLITWSTQLLDVPLLIEDYSSDNGYLVWPRNYSTSGAYTSSWSKEYNFVFSCLQRSLNTAAAQLVELLSPSECFEFLYYRLHLSTLVLYDNGSTDVARSPMSVGALTNGVTLQELTTAYQIFGNGGKYYESTFISRILDNSGEIVYSHSLVGEQVIEESTAYVMNRMLETVVSSSRGTGRLARLDGVELIAKTGTTQDWYDLWFIGCTPEYVTGLWIGYDTPQEIDTSNCYGSSQMWKNIFGDIAEAEEVKTFDASSSVVTREYCTETGLIAGSNCTSTATGYYKKTNIPATCSGDHTKTEIDLTIESLSSSDTAVIVTSGVDVNEYIAITGNSRYTFLTDILRDWSNY